ncbi:MAG: hypothetical protein EOM52_03375 [Clostridia bacterium]|nr:hypothetical protein [Clostridia bacterium]
MKIALINGSPKAKRSASGVILNGIRSSFAPADEVLDFHLATAIPAERDLLRLCGCSAFVFAFPLYVDGVPGHLVACLERLAETLKIAPPKERMGYAVCNCGFYEGRQAQLALEVMAHWAGRSGLRWGWGLGVGAGGMLADNASAPLGHGAWKDLGKALGTLAHDLDAGKTGADRFVAANLPRAVYKTVGEFGWRQAVKRNGLRTKDLDTRR